MPTDPHAHAHSHHYHHPRAPHSQAGAFFPVLLVVCSQSTQRLPPSLGPLLHTPTIAPPLLKPQCICVLIKTKARGLIHPCPPTVMDHLPEVVSATQPLAGREPRSSQRTVRFEQSYQPPCWSELELLIAVWLEIDRTTQDQRDRRRE